MRAFLTRTRAWVQRTWKRILVVLAVLMGTGTVVVNFIPQNPPTNYHVFPVYTQTGKAFTWGQAFAYKVVVWDDSGNPVSGAKTLSFLNYERNTGVELTTGGGGYATHTWPVQSTTGYNEFWLPSGMSSGTSILTAQFVGDQTHRSTATNSFVPRSASAPSRRILVKDGSGNALPEIQTYNSGAASYQLWVYDATDQPVASQTVRVEAPGVWGNCATNGSGWCSVTVDLEAFRRGANMLFFYTTNPNGGFWAQPVYRSTERDYHIPAYHPSTVGQTMWWTSGYWWYSGGVRTDCSDVCGCADTNERAHNEVVGRAHFLGFGSFYNSNGTYNLDNLRNLKSNTPSGIDAGIYIYDRDASGTGTWSGNAYCWSGSAWEACAVSNANRYNNVDYPAGKLGEIVNGSNGWVVKSPNANYVYFFPPYGYGYAQELFNLAKEIAKDEFDYAGTPFANLSFGVGGDAEFVLLESAAQAYFPNITLVPGLSGSFNNTAYELQRLMPTVDFQYILPVQRNINITKGDSKLYGIGRIGVGIQSASAELPLLDGGWMAASQMYAMNTSRYLQLPTGAETKADGIFQGDNCGSDDFSGLFFRTLYWAPIVSVADWHKVTNECVYASADSGNAHAQYIAALVEQVKLQTSFAGEETDSGLAYLVFRSASTWPGGEGLEWNTVPASDWGAYMYRLDSWGAATAPKYYTDVPSGARSGTYYNEVNFIRGATTPAMSQGEAIPSGGKVYVNALGSWRWHDATMSEPIVRVVVLGTAGTGNLKIHYNTPTGNTSTTVSIDGTNTWQMKEVTLSNAVANYGVDGRDFALEAVGGPVWILLFMVDNTEDTGVPTPVPPATGTATFTPNASHTATPTPTRTHTPGAGAQPTWTRVPAYTYVEAASDTYLDGWNPTTNYGDNHSLLLRAGVYNPVIKFDLSGVSGAIQSARLQVYSNQRTNSCWLSGSLYALKVPFSEGQSTWNLSAAGTPWATPGARGADVDYISPAYGSILLEVSNGNVLSGDIKDLVNYWRGNPDQNHGLVIHSASQCSVGYDIRSSDAPWGGAELVIQFVGTPTPTATPTHTSVPPTITPTPTATVWAFPSPTVQYATFYAIEDTRMDSYNANTNYGSDASSVQRYDSYNGIYHDNLYRFDFSPIDGADIISATYYSYVHTDYGYTINCNVYMVRRDWVEGEATWNEYASGAAWGTAGARNTSTDISTGDGATLSYNGTGWKASANFGLGLERGLRDGLTSYSILVVGYGAVDRGGGTEKYVRVYHSEDPNLKPYIHVAYKARPAEPNFPVTLSARINETSKTQTSNTMWSLVFKYDVTGAARYFPMYYADLSGIPGDATVHFAKLMYFTILQGGSSFDLKVQRVVSPWTSAVTWNRRDSSNDWATAGCLSATSDYTTTNEASHTMAAAREWNVIDVTGIVQDQLTSGNYGMILRGVNDSTNTYYITGAPNAGVQYRPGLYIAYSTPAPTPTPSATPTSTLTPSVTPTSTPTPTWYPTSTPTQTPVPTETPTMTPTPTPTLTPIPDVVINEVMVNPQEDYDGNGVVDDGDKYVALYSPTTASVYLWQIEVDDETYRLPQRTIVGGTELVIYNSSMDIARLLTGETVVLYTVSGEQADAVTVAAVGAGYAYGRCPSASTNWTEILPSPGLENCQ